MTDIELVIKISEDAYNYIKANGARIPYYKLSDAIKNGTRLPKNHGDLIDRGMLPTDYITDDDIADAQAIIKAHKEGQK